MTLLTDAEREVADWLGDREAEMLALLERVVNTDSGSYDKAGVDAVGKILKDFLDAAGVTVDTVPVAQQGDVIRADVPGRLHAAPVLLLGHRDTVFEKGEASRRPFRIENARGYGPGVADMKSGLVMNAYVLAAFSATGKTPLPVRAVFTGDEEIASPGSRSIIESEARQACAVFNAEPGRASGGVVVARKGGLFFRGTITGREAHSGTSFSAGVSAIEEMARKIQALHRLVDLEKGITVNVGTVSGGRSINTVAGHARLEVDVRYMEPGDRARILEDVFDIGRRCGVEGAGSDIELFGEFLPLVQSPGAKALFDRYVEAAAALGMTVTGEVTGGCADSGLAASVGTPTLCATGPVGHHLHTEAEYAEIDTMVPRAQALALTILRLGHDQAP